MRLLTSILTLAILFGAAEARAQDATAVDLHEELRTMVTAPAQADGHRQAVRDFLEREDVHAVAAERGLNMATARAALESIDDAAVADLARHVHAFEEDADLVGGNTIVISTTTVIIALLILILVTD